MKQPKCPIREGQIVEGSVTGYTSEGAGVIRVEGLAVFVPGTIRGEQVRVRIDHIGHTAGYGALLEVLSPSPHRLAPLCPYTHRCGGCVFWHMTYEEELRAKSQRVADALQRIGGVEVDDLPITGGDTVCSYRNKAQFPVAQQKGRPVAGFFRQRSHQVVPVKRCLIQTETADRAKAAVLQWMEQAQVSVFDEKAHRGLVRHIYVRTAMATGQVLVCLVINGDEIPKKKLLLQLLQEQVEGLTSVCLSLHKKRGNAVLGDQFVTLFGPGYIEDILCGLRFRLSARSFYQVNREQAQRLYAAALRLADLSPEDTALDLYCGTGTISLVLAKQAGRVIGVEVIPQAIEDARENALRNGVRNAEFLCADAAEAARRFAEEGIRPDVIVVDPPRKGLDEAVVSAMVTMAPKRIVYVSCDPATLARDVRRLTEQGYALRSAEAFDLFPRCGHVESVALLTLSGDMNP